VLEGDQIKMVDGSASGLPPWIQSAGVMVKLAVSMRAHGRGGSLLVVPANTEQWRESIVHPMPYAVSAPCCDLAPMNDPVVAAVAGLTAVDGAVVLTDHYELLGFGAKIARRKGSPQVEQVMITEPVEGSRPVLVHPEQLGGTRHLSAAQFIHDQRDALALVASQDGRFTVFEWSQDERMVHARRLDALLL
jgi:DNA integrity scanning protein DisA with diadenylate cyclase activity